MINTKSVYDPPAREDGTRILVMRFWPRGIAKSLVHEWWRELGTSPELIRSWKGKKIEWPEFRGRYLAEMGQQKAAIAELARRARKETLTLLCSCREEARCHRSLLKGLIERAMGRV